MHVSERVTLAFARSGLFIIDPKGIVRHITINDFEVGRSVDETLRLVKAFQFADVHGEVCPAGWTPGKPTVRAHLSCMDEWSCTGVWNADPEHLAVDEE